MLKAAIAAIRSGESPSVMPKTKAEAATYLQNLKNQKAPACQIDFAQRVFAGY
jgi:hypothetical protein